MRGDLGGNGRPVFILEGQVFKLEEVMYYLDPKSVGSMGFLGGKERIQIPINSKHSSLEALKRVLMGVPNSQLTTNFWAKYQSTTIFGPILSKLLNLVKF